MHGLCWWGSFWSAVQVRKRWRPVGGPARPGAGQAGPTHNEEAGQFQRRVVRSGPIRAKPGQPATNGSRLSLNEACIGPRWASPGQFGPLRAPECVHDVKVRLRVGLRPDQRRFSVLARALRAYVFSVIRCSPFTHGKCTDVRHNLQKRRRLHSDINRGI